MTAKCFIVSLAAWVKYLEVQLLAKEKHWTAIKMDWKLEKRRINELKDSEKNPRKISKSERQQLQRSVEKFGVCQPIVVNWDGTIIGGHQRVRVLKKMGEKEVDVYLPSTPLDEKEVDELGIRLNKAGGSFDFDSLANFFDASDLVEWGFTMQELHLESIPEGEEGEEKKKPQKCTMTISFEDAEHLQEAETEIAPIIEAYEGAKYRVKLK